MQCLPSAYRFIYEANKVAILLYFVNNLWKISQSDHISPESNEGVEFCGCLFKPPYFKANNINYH